MKPLNALPPVTFLLCVVFLFAPIPVRAVDGETPSADLALSLPDGVARDNDGYPFIANIGRFLNTCPQNDPAISTIRADFKIYHNGVEISDIYCAAPVSQMPLASYSDELIVLQTLRAIYYEDRGETGHLPWTPGSLYDWMKADIGGIEIDDDSPDDHCCVLHDGRIFFVIRPNDDSNRDFKRGWKGISMLLALFAHETRHMDGDGYLHENCIGFSSDDNYDIGDLSARGVQWWMLDSWLVGRINVGFACLPDAADIAQWNLYLVNSIRDTFCYTKPPLDGMPTVPGGACRPAIKRAEVIGAQLRLHGLNFRLRSKIILNGIAQPTRKSGALLVSDTAGAKIPPGAKANLKVRNPDGTAGPRFVFVRHAE